MITHLFADIPGAQASPHDLRRGFGTTYKRVARLRLGVVKLILDHSEDVDSADVTTNHYSFDPRIAEKRPIVEGWCAWIDAQASI